MHATWVPKALKFISFGVPTFPAFGREVGYQDPYHKQRHREGGHPLHSVPSHPVSFHPTPKHQDHTQLALKIDTVHTPPVWTLTINH